MREAVLPFLGYLVLQLGVMVIGASVVPSYLKKGELIEAHLFGHAVVWALIQILAISMIQLRTSFDVLYYTFLAITVCLFMLGLLRIRKTQIEWPERPVVQMKADGNALTPAAIIFLVIAALLIFGQFLAYFMGMHLDEDDARWLAEANDAIVYNRLMTINERTGDYQGFFSIPKDIASPWPMYLAILSKLLSVRVSVFAHTLYAPVALLMVYEVYLLLSRELFKSLDARFAFIAAVAFINYFYAGTVYTQSVFTLVRIWQGKATVAGVMLPLLVWLFIRINREDRTGDWLRVMLTCCASSLMSGMGISLGAVVILVYGGYSILAYQRWKRIPMWFLSVAPAVLFTVLYFFYKGW